MGSTTYRIDVPAGVALTHNGEAALFTRERDGALLRKIDDPDMLVTAAP